MMRSAAARAETRFHGARAWRAAERPRPPPTRGAAAAASAGAALARAARRARPARRRDALQNLTGTPARTELEVVAHVARLGGAAALRFEGSGVGLEEGARRVGPAPFEERH